MEHGDVRLHLLFVAVSRHTVEEAGVLLLLEVEDGHRSTSDCNGYFVLFYIKKYVKNYSIIFYPQSCNFIEIIRNFKQIFIKTYKN